MQSGWFSFVILKDFLAAVLIIVVQRALAAPGGKDKSLIIQFYFSGTAFSFPVTDYVWLHL